VTWNYRPLEYRALRKAAEALGGKSNDFTSFQGFGLPSQDADQARATMLKVCLKIWPLHRD